MTVCRLVALSLGLVGLPVQAAQRVTLLLSEPGGIYLEAAQALQRELSRDGGRWSVRLHSVSDSPDVEGQDGWTVTLGVRALRYALAAPGDGPLFALLVPSLTFEQLTAEQPSVGRQRTMAALFLDQPFARQLHLIRLALPQAKRVCVVAGPTTQVQVGNLDKTAREIGLELRVRTIRSQEQLFTSLKALAQEADVLLLLPDPLVVNGATLKNLFLQTYRQRLPIVAYSAGLVRAGALLGLYATPTQVGLEAGQWLREIPWGKEMKGTATRVPKAYVVDVNRNVARSLELRLPSVEELNEQLDAERGR